MHSISITNLQCLSAALLSGIFSLFSRKMTGTEICRLWNFLRRLASEERLGAIEDTGHLDAY